MYKLPENILQALANYLGTRPYNEVVNLILALSRLERVVEVDVEQEKVGE